MTYEEFVKIMKLIAYQARIIEEVAPDKFDPSSRRVGMARNKVR